MKKMRYKYIVLFGCDNVRPRVCVGVKKKQIQKARGAVAFHAIADRPTTPAAAPMQKYTAGSVPAKVKEIRWNLETENAGGGGNERMEKHKCFLDLLGLDRPHIASTLPLRFRCP